MTELTFDTVDYSNDTKNFKRGDVVKLYNESEELKFPCVMLTCDRLEMFRVRAMQGLFSSRSLLQDEDQYPVYIGIQGQLIQVGEIANDRLKQLLTNKIFSIFDKKIFLSKDKSLSGNMLFALCKSVAN